MKTEITYKYHPDHLKAIVDVFNQKANIHSSINNLLSNQVLGKISAELKKLSFEVEANKIDTIEVPVMYGLNGSIEKSFRCGASSNKTKTVLEMESGSKLSIP